MNAPAPPSLDLPYYGISFGGAISRAFKKYANFKGRASRSEYWWWTLFITVVYILLVVPAFILGTQTSADGGRTPGTAGVPFLVVFAVFILGVIVPSLALMVRRLHDGGFSGLFALLALVPSVGGLVTTVLALMPSSANGLRFDPFPPVGQPDNPPPYSQYPPTS